MVLARLYSVCTSVWDPYWTFTYWKMISYAFTQFPWYKSQSMWKYVHRYTHYIPKKLNVCECVTTDMHINSDYMETGGEIRNVIDYFRVCDVTESLRHNSGSDSVTLFFVLWVYVNKWKFKVYIQIKYVFMKHCSAFLVLEKSEIWPAAHSEWGCRIPWNEGCYQWKTPGRLPLERWPGQHLSRWDCGPGGGAWVPLSLPERWQMTTLDSKISKSFLTLSNIASVYTHRKGWGAEQKDTSAFINANKAEKTHSHHPPSQRLKGQMWLTGPNLASSAS